MNREQDRSAAFAPSSAQYSPVLNIFRHKLTPDLFCAVPDDYPVPGFLHAGAWSFAAAASEAACAFGELNWAAARAGARLTGFYFFQACPARHRAVEASWDEAAPSAEPASSYPAGPTGMEPEPIIDCFA